MKLFPKVSLNPGCELSSDFFDETFFDRKFPWKARVLTRLDYSRLHPDEQLHHFYAFAWASVKRYDPPLEVNFKYDQVVNFLWLRLPKK